MTKRKLLTGALSLSMVAILAVGGTLAYFTDTDGEDNVFTTGNVAIDLTETFDEENAKLLPATGSAQDGTLENGIEKRVFVTNEGSEDAYVRVHIAIPAILDNVDNAGKNTLHFNYDPEAVGEGKWDWSKTTGTPHEGEWNVYGTTLADGKDYNVYVVTYEGILSKDQMTEEAMTQVYLDKLVTNEKIAEIQKVLGDKWHIYVAAEGAQAKGFDNAYEALNTAFGVPGTYDVEWVVDEN